MRVSEAFPSKWLKADDIGERRKVRCVIQDCQMEKVQEDSKIVVYFKNKDKGLMLNKTNAGRISAAYGDETEDWTGKELFLYVEKVPFNGQLVPSIRVDVPRIEATFEEDPPAAAPARQPQPVAAAAIVGASDDGDEIPF